MEIGVLCTTGNMGKWLANKRVPRRTKKVLATKVIDWKPSQHHCNSSGDYDE
jgi:hypothetical protein